MLDHNRLLELALEGLEAERLRLDEEMAAIRRQLRGSAAPSRMPAAPQSQKQDAGKGRSRRRSRLTPAGRKKLSELMKKRWAERRKAAAKK
jgi:hypothetical protein